MTRHSSATVRAEKPHATRTTRTATIIDALKRRAQAVLDDESLDARTRAILRKGLQTNDPWFAELLRRDAAANIADSLDFSQTIEPDENGPGEKLEALAEIICGAGDEPAGALLVLMRAIQNSTDPKALANTVKHFAFTRCGELNLFGMVDAQIAVVEGELL